MKTDPIVDARALIAAVLAGEIGPRTHRPVFEDDLLFFAVDRVEREDVDWLRGQLLDGDVPGHRRRLVAGQLAGPLRAEVLAAIPPDDDDDDDDDD